MIGSNTTPQNQLMSLELPPRLNTCSCHLSFFMFLCVAQREKLVIAKEVTLGLSLFVKKFSWVRKHCKHLEQWDLPLEG